MRRVRSRHFTGAMDTPESLGEAYHLLQAKADVNYWIGRALKALGRDDEARNHFKLSANEAGDFSEMAVTAHSPLSYFRGLSLRELGREDDARAMFADLKAFAETKLKETAKIDYFATSLPNLLVFEEDLQARRDAENHLLLALAHHGLGETAAARAALAKTAGLHLRRPIGGGSATGTCNGLIPIKTAAVSGSLQRVAKLAERPLLLIRRHPGDDVAGKAADDGKKFRERGFAGRSHRE